jgi:hypothetical protein
MAGYREAMRQSDRLGRLNGAFIHHVVAVSGEAASNRLLTRVDNAQQLATEIREFAQEVRRRDAIAGILSFGQAQTKARLGALLTFSGVVAIGVAIYAFFTQLGDLGLTFGAMMNFQELKGAFLKQSLLSKLFTAAYLIYGAGALLTGIGEYFDLIGETIHASHPSQLVLAKTVDEPEARLFALTGGIPPGRPTMKIVGPLGACVLLLAGVVTVWFVGHVVYGAFAPKQSVLPEDPFSKLLNPAAPYTPTFDFDTNRLFIKIPDSTSSNR